MKRYEVRWEVISGTLPPDSATELMESYHFKFGLFQPRRFRRHKSALRFIQVEMLDLNRIELYLSRSRPRVSKYIQPVLYKKGIRQ